VWGALEMKDEFEDIPDSELERLRKKASSDWSGATVAFHRFQQLVKEFRASRNRKTRKSITLTFNDIEELLRLAHPKAVFERANQDFIDKKYPGWEWNEIIPRLFKEDILYKEPKGEKSISINNLYIDSDISRIHLSPTSNSVEIMRTKSFKK
jgi:hypothetical protein